MSDYLSGNVHPIFGVSEDQADAMLNKYRNSMLSKGLGTGTVNLYIRHISRYAQGRHLNAATTENLEQYIARHRDTHAAETRKSIRTALASYYGWAYRTSRISHNPAADLQPVRCPAKVPRIAPDEVVQMGLLTADNQLAAMILLARYGCLRLTELTTLHMRQREHDTLRIVGKGEKERLVPINDDLMGVLLTVEREHGYGYYFPGRTGPHMHPMSVNKVITRHLGVNPHSLRHAGATAAYRATRDLRAVQTLLGHSSLATTQRYLHVNMDEVRAAAAGTTLAALGTFPTTTIARTAA